MNHRDTEAQRKGNHERHEAHEKDGKLNHSPFVSFVYFVVMLPVFLSVPPCLCG